jgi:hypothetical protein
MKRRGTRCKILLFNPLPLLEGEGGGWGEDRVIPSDIKT